MTPLKAIIFIFIMYGCTARLVAQSISDLPSNSSPFNMAGQSYKTFDGRYAGITGTYTFFEEFTPGIIELMKGKFNNVLINYDAYSDNLLAINDKIKDTVMLRKDLVSSFVLKPASAEEVLFVKKSLNGVPTFLYELEKDSISLYCKVSKTIKKAEIGGAYNISGSNYDEFVTVNTFYVLKGFGELVEIQKSKKGVIKAFPEFENQLSDYLKKNKLDLNDYRHMRLMIQYVNTL